MDEPNAPAAENVTESSLDPAEESVLDEVLVEEVSIDGMCGVY